MDERLSSAHITDEEAVREFIRTREHIQLQADLPEDIREALERDPNPQTLQWVLDESTGDIKLLRLLLEREETSQQLLNPDAELRIVQEQLQPLKIAIRKRKEELGIYKK